MLFTIAEDSLAGWPKMQKAIPSLRFSGSRNNDKIAFAESAIVTGSGFRFRSCAVSPQK